MAGAPVLYLSQPFPVPRGKQPIREGLITAADHRPQDTHPDADPLLSRQDGRRNRYQIQAHLPLPDRADILDSYCGQGRLPAQHIQQRLPVQADGVTLVDIRAATAGRGDLGTGTNPAGLSRSQHRSSTHLGGVRLCNAIIHRGPERHLNANTS
jgi:hypothetical protein